MIISNKRGERVLEFFPPAHGWPIGLVNFEGLKRARGSSAGIRGAAPAFVAIKSTRTCMCTRRS
jgi:hypothetical protein